MRILVKMLTGRTITLEVNRSDTIETFKTKIQEKEGFPPHHQMLLFRHTKLKEGTIADYGIQKDSTLYLLPCLIGSMQIFVMTPTGTTLTLEVDKSDTVENIKTMIWEKDLTRPDQQVLMVGHTFLEDGKKPTEYNIQNGSTIHLLVRCKDFIEIYVKALGGKTIILEVKSYAAIEKVKSCIEDEKGIPTKKLKLYINGRLMKDGKTLIDYNIQKGSTIHLAYSSCGLFRIFVDTLVGKTIILEVKRYFSIKKVKSYIEDKDGIPPHHQSLIFGNGLLEDGKTLADYNIDTDTSIFLVPWFREFIEILVKTPKGKTIAIEVTSCDTVENVKAKIHAEEGVPPDQQRLFFGFVHLEEGRSFAEYNIQNQSTIKLEIEKV